MTLTMELPDSLIKQFQEQQIGEQELKALAIAALEIWLADQRSPGDGRFSESAAPFVRRLISENRELFEALAQR